MPSWWKKVQNNWFLKKYIFWIHVLCKFKIAWISPWKWSHEMNTLRVHIIIFICLYFVYFRQIVFSYQCTFLGLQTYINFISVVWWPCIILHTLLSATSDSTGHLLVVYLTLDAAFWEAKESTKKQIQQIEFGSRRYQQITPTGTPVINQGADNAVNVFGGGTLVLRSGSEVSLTGSSTACKQTMAG